MKNPSNKKDRPDNEGSKGDKEPRKLTLEFILIFYDAYLREKSLNQAAAALEMKTPTLTRMVRLSKNLQLAMDIADKHRSKGELKTYVLRNLSPTARAVYEKIETSESLAQVEDIFRNQGECTKLRQEIFIAYLVAGGFDMSKACLKTGISRHTLESWRQDLEFLQLLEEVQWHKKNYFEQALIGLVAEGHPGAVVFVNRTQNSDRGYSEKLQVNHQGNIAMGNTLSLEDLDLDVDTMMKIHAAIEKKNAANPNLLPMILPT